MRLPSQQSHPRNEPSPSSPGNERACGNIKDVEENKVAAEWGALFPRILHGFPASSRGGPRLPSESTHPAAFYCGPEVDEIIARLGLCRGTARTSTLYSRTKKPARQAASSFRFIGLSSVALPRKTSRLARLAEII